jgi:hypothetical protein
MDILHSLTTLWEKRIRYAEKVKRDQFGRMADRAWKFLGKNYEDLYLGTDGAESFPHSEHRVRRNITAEYRALMLPTIHHKVPHRLVSPSRPPLPPELEALLQGPPMPAMPGMPPPISPALQQRMILDQQDAIRSWLMQFTLNHWPNHEYNLRDETRQAATEALIKGRGIVVHSLIPGIHGYVPASHYMSVDNLLIDPDTEHAVRDAGWIALKYRRHVWKLAEEFEIPRDEIRGKYKSAMERSLEDSPADAASDEKGDADEKERDVVDVYYVYSRAGLGQKFLSADEDIKRVAQSMDDLGDNAFLVICPGVNYPLNLPPHIATLPDARDEIQARLSWPIPFYANYDNPWPFTHLDFYKNLDNVWSASPLEGAMPLLSFLDHAYGYLMSRVRTTSRDIILAAAELEDALKKAIVSGRDQEVVTVDGKTVEDLGKLVEVLQFPSVQKDLYQVIAMVEQAAERATGLTALLYGNQGKSQMRSSAEAQIRQDNTMSRPEDMAECAERWHSEIARAEGFMARVMVAPNTVAPLFGEAVQESAIGPLMGPLTQAWAQLVNTPDPLLAAAELSYTIEAGSGRRKNKQKQQQDVEILSQNLFQPLLGYAAQTGNVGPINALVRLIGDAHEMDVREMMFPPPMLPPPGAGPPEGEPAPAPPGA